MSNYSISSLKKGLFDEWQLNHASWMKLIDNAIRIKYCKKNQKKLLPDKTIAIFFEKPSTRTRCAVETAFAHQGATTTFLAPNTLHIGKDESIEDTAKVFGRYYNGIFYRGYKTSTVKNLALYSNIPVWNGLTDSSHPTQMLADTMTMIEYAGEIRGKSLAFIGDGRGNIALSLINTAAILGIDLRIITPKKLYPSIDDKVVDLGRRNGGNITIGENLAFLTNANFIYTDVWLSMGEDESLLEERISLLKTYRVTAELIKQYSPNAYIMHCLPSIHNTESSVGKMIYEKYGLNGVEIEDKVFKSNNSIVFDQAENRLHTIESLVLASLL